MKTKEELNKPKQQCEKPNEQCRELTEEELAQVTGGVGNFDIRLVEDTG